MPSGVEWLMSSTFYPHYLTQISCSARCDNDYDANLFSVTVWMKVTAGAKNAVTE